MKVELLEHTKLSNAVLAGRICYQSGVDYDSPTDELLNRDIKYLNRLVNKLGHKSISRHIKYIFRVNGLSTKALLHLSRHQVGVDLSVMSSRFVKLDKFSKGYTTTPNESVNELLKKHIEEIHDLNESESISAEDLSMLYPQAMQYDLIVSMNLQSLQHLIELRNTKEAHFDIRHMTQLMIDALPEEHKFMFV